MDLVVLGVDGVSPDYLEEALEKYDMPGWEKLRDEAFYSDLESCVPAVTIPAWVSMFSGYDAGKFGAFHLTQPDFDSWETGLRKTSFPNTFFWDRIKGRSSLHNIPGTSPVYKIDGWMKGGFPSPHDFDFYPEELEQEMNFTPENHQRSLLEPPTNTWLEQLMLTEISPRPTHSPTTRQESSSQRDRVYMKKLMKNWKTCLM